MSDDEDQGAPPVIDLAAFRQLRGLVGPRKGTPIKLEVRDGKLWLHHEATMRDRQIGLGPEHIRYLREKIHEWEVAEREKELGPRRHRCYTCNRVKWIECRGHRAWGETRIHYATEILERSSYRVRYAGSLVTAIESMANPNSGGGEVREAVRSARTACQRVSGSVSLTWDDVDCSRCLKRKPSLVVG